MKNITLKFPSIHLLWLFRRTISLVSLQVDPALRTLSCACNDDEINLAISSYEAEIVETKGLLHPQQLRDKNNKDIQTG